MRSRWIPALALAALLAACGGGDSSPTHDGGETGVASASSAPSSPQADPPPVPHTLTRIDDGRDYLMDVGDVVEVVIDDPAAAEPTVDGSAIVLVRVLNIQADARREWELRAVTAGAATVSVVGEGGFSIGITVREQPRDGS